MPPAGAKRRKVEIGARKQRRVGWLTLANIPCARAVFAGVSQGLGLDMPSETSTVCADLEVEKLRRELAQVQELQTATAEILRVISNSTTDLKRVFQKIAASAARLCAARDATILQVDGDNLRVVAHHGPIPPGETLPLTRAVVTGCAVLDRRTIHVTDLQTETDNYPEGSDRAQRLGHRTILAVPLMRASGAIGVIAMRRTEVRPFTNQQIALLKAFADQAVIAIENTRLFEAEQASKRELQEALEYQTATSEVLNVISRSKFDLQPVVDTIVETAVRLCRAHRGALMRFEGGGFRLLPTSRGNLSGPITQGLVDKIVPIDRGSTAGRVAIEGCTVHIHDLQADPDFTFLRGTEGDSRRTCLGVPLIGNHGLLGAIILQRTEVLPFTDRQIELVETFADQAVIAFENTRLFEAEQASKRELQESLEYQTAMSEVLSVISRSPTNAQPVFDAIVDSAARLCEASISVVWLYDGELLHYAASQNFTSEVLDQIRKIYPKRPDRSIAAGRAILDGRINHVPNMLADGAYAHELALAGNWRASLSVPMLRDGKPVGAISIGKSEAAPFTERQIQLLATFSDQAVIAIENTRLFEAEQASKRELSEALEQQTAASQVLSVISRSPGELDPVFQAMLENAVRICEAKFGVLFECEEGKFRAKAWVGVPAMYEESLRQRGSFQPEKGAPLERLLRTKILVHAADEFAENSPSPAAKLGGARSLIAAPMFKEDELVGAIVIYRTEIRPFTGKHVELVQTFANQAVIAIENMRLLSELRESLQQQTATADVLKVISRSPTDIQPVLDAVAKSAAALCEAGAVAVFRRDGNQLRLVANHRPLGHVIVGEFSIPLIRGTANGRSVLEGRTIHIADIQSEVREYPEGSETGRKLGHRTILAVPLVREGIVIGSIGLRRASAQLFTDAQVALVETFADQAVIAIENTRLFQEVQARTRELAKTIEDLEIASQHKNQFVANMSHELRTPLAAILGYAELMQEGFYDPLSQKSLDALTRIRSNGKHLLSLINTVLDIAKIESGQFTLNMSEYAIETVVETVRAATESLAQNKRLALTTSVDKPLPIGLGDEQRLTQVLLNLVGNAIKFTDAGVVSIAAGARNGNFAVSVTDTGPGIPLDQQDRIFDQFHQVDSSITKAKGGTGLGLTIAKQIVEMHGGRIWVESAPGKGSTFQMELPTRAQFDKKTP